MQHLCCTGVAFSVQNHLTILDRFRHLFLVLSVMLLRFLSQDSFLQFVVYLPVAIVTPRNLFGPLSVMLLLPLRAYRSEDLTGDQTL